MYAFQSADARIIVVPQSYRGMTVRRRPIIALLAYRMSYPMSGSRVAIGSSMRCSNSFGPIFNGNKNIGSILSLSVYVLNVDHVILPWEVPC